MRRFSMLLAGAFALGACAPARTPVAGPADVPPPPRAAEPVEPAEPEGADPADAASTAPEHWWLLDAGTDGVRGTSVERAYRELLAGKRPARQVVVAVIDGGIDLDHQDLDDNLWVNEDEVAGNGKDDDGNGYIDDVHGWNFIGGPDGRQVDHDTYEVTRLYARYRERYEGADPDTLTGAARAEYERFRKVEEAYQTERQETTQMLQQVRAMDAAVDRFTALLRQHLGVDSLTVERVRAIRSPRRDVQQARQVYLQLAANGVTPAMIDEELERLDGLMQYGLNPSFDPRPIVGDDYTDASERRYGNADVEGPDPFHGTHVAGIIGAERGNGIGVDGIAPAVRIMAVRAVPDGDERDKDVANAIRYAVDNGADIINMSFGKPFSPRKDVVDAAVRYADEHGVLMIHAAGNDGADLGAEPSFPSRVYEDGDTARNWIEVGASSWQDADHLAAPFSNYGDHEVDVFAPGVAIVSTIPDDGYGPASGTSMAAPVVTGLAALLMAYYPDLDAADVKRIILESATRYAEQPVVRPGEDGGQVPFGRLSATGGIVNAYAAIRMAEGMR
ncbi:MAG TPA: S8 family serine peptidase [Longimicrobiales bacterium]